jgi:hypothetical protein
MKKGYISDHQFKDPAIKRYPKTKDEYDKARSEHNRYSREALTPKKVDIEKEFWEKLVQLNWKLNTTSGIANTKWIGNSTHLMLVCPECDVPLRSIPVKNIGVSESISGLIGMSKSSVVKHMEEDRCQAKGKAISKEVAK